jgi:hypothetical protein
MTANLQAGSGRAQVAEVIRISLGEVLYGWSGRYMQKLPENFKKNAKVLESKIANEDWQFFTREEKFDCLLAITATIYFLGPEELDTIAGHTIFEFLNAGRKLFVSATGASGLETEWI